MMVSVVKSSDACLCRSMEDGDGDPAERNMSDCSCIPTAKWLDFDEAAWSAEQLHVACAKDQSR